MFSLCYIALRYIFLASVLAVPLTQIAINLIFSDKIFDNKFIVIIDNNDNRTVCQSTSFAIGLSVCGISR